MYYENNEEERTERIWNLCTKAILIVFVIIATIGYFTIDFEKIDNHIKIEKNEQ